jgi:hypothetical protein
MSSMPVNQMGRLVLSMARASIAAEMQVRRATSEAAAATSEAAAATSEAAAATSEAAAATVEQEGHGEGLNEVKIQKRY